MRHKHTECLTSLALSPTASFAASARVPAEASESFATSVLWVSRRYGRSEGAEWAEDVLLFVSLLAVSVAPLTVSLTELKAFLVTVSEGCWVCMCCCLDLLCSVHL